jgi:hypothetical protein
MRFLPTTADSDFATEETLLLTAAVLVPAAIILLIWVVFFRNKRRRKRRRRHEVRDMPMLDRAGGLPPVRGQENLMDQPNH